MQYRLSILVLAAAVALGAGSSTFAADVDRRASSVDEAHLDADALEQAALEALRESLELASQSRDLQVEVADVRAVPVSVASVAVDGVARLRIATGEWIPLRFNAGYSLLDAQIYGMRVQPLTSAISTRSAPIESSIAERVKGQVATRILAEFPDQTLDVAFVDLQPTFDARGHIAFRGTGLVDFDAEGAAPVAFTAVFDRGSGLVVALDYSLEIAGAHGESELNGVVALLR